uniref:Reverse transcriptase domain-containing protein n=2 Tax=Photinus pyralis TaxID=7054 RepID=A0A1Y1N254_PHOPY
MQFTHFSAGALDERAQVDCVYTDFAKAFDTVSHQVLLRKLVLNCVSNPTVKFLKSYLSLRKTRVKFNGVNSAEFYPSSGVPQGTLLGPFLFLLYINDLPRVIKNSKALLFADDLKLFNKVQSPSDCLNIQEDINSVIKWCIKNKLKLNINKCKVLTFTRSKNPLLFDYKMNGKVLLRVTSVKDLGVFFNTNLNFNLHIEYLTNECYKLLGFVIRNTLNFTNIQTMITLYNAFIRSKLEYAACIWSPQTLKYSDMIEKVQKKFFRVMFFRTTHNYPHLISYGTQLNYLNSIFGLKITALNRNPMVHRIHNFCFQNFT